MRLARALWLVFMLRHVKDATCKSFSRLTKLQEVYEANDGATKLASIQEMSLQIRFCGMGMQID